MGGTKLGPLEPGPEPGPELGCLTPPATAPWLDFQYEPERWYSFVVLLANGVMITTMTLIPTLKNPTVSLVIMKWVFTVDKDSYPTELGVGRHQYYILQVLPGQHTSEAHLTQRSAGDGEQRAILSRRPPQGYQDSRNVFIFWGVFDGQPIAAWGNSERMSGL